MPTPFESLQVPQAYWNHAAETYNEVFGETIIGKITRDVVWRELDARFKSGSRVLELNCGTGIDAVHLARRGVSVLACDISSRMIELARQNATACDLNHRVDFRVLPTEQLPELKDEPCFDGAFSNFCGLNCVRDLTEVRRNLASLLRPGARLIVCMLGTFPLWEKLRYASKGDWKKVLRTFPHNDDASRGIAVHCLSRMKIMEAFDPHFKLRKWKGIAITVPPSNMEQWAQRFPRTIGALGGVDRILSNLPVLKGLGGCILLEFERTQELEGRPEACA